MSHSIPPQKVLLLEPNAKEFLNLYIMQKSRGEHVSNKRVEMYLPPLPTANTYRNLLSLPPLLPFSRHFNSTPHLSTAVKFSFNPPPPPQKQLFNPQLPPTPTISSWPFAKSVEVW
ncbi:hypothetical protein CDAR_475921 [Caerostris darwini]|uniref:Uncharacterized protein n=1 Tax=Caerostris darwini TaxID=1538125 RepID=A0AAV4PA03_9ARAC|nr:hypothetical protein CDAR_475921 [Caerostris darwini]